MSWSNPTPESASADDAPRPHGLCWKRIGLKLAIALAAYVLGALLTGVVIVAFVGGGLPAIVETIKTACTLPVTGLAHSWGYQLFVLVAVAIQVLLLRRGVSGLRIGASVLWWALMHYLSPMVLLFMILLAFKGPH